MFTSFNELEEIAKEVAKNVGLHCQSFGQNISFSRDCQSSAYMAITYSPSLNVAYNIFGNLSERAIYNEEQLETMLRHEILISG